MLDKGKFYLGVTQQEIADMLSISRSSVAFALNPKHRHKLLPETAKLILDKAKECGYQPKKFATVLGTGRSYTIGVVYQLGLYHAQMQHIRHLARHTIEAGYQMAAVDIGWFQGKMEDVRNHLISSSVEGIVYCNLNESCLACCGYTPLKHIPQISISGDAMEGVENVSPDIERAFYDITRHHLENGSKELLLQFAFHDHGLCGFPGTSISRRFNGFRRAIEEAGGSLELSKLDQSIFGFRPSRRRRTIHGRVNFPVRRPEHVNAFAVGYHETTLAIECGHIPNSIICSNDEIAAGSITACMKKGIAIPSQVRISGADDAPFAAYCGIPITTISQPTEQITKLAIERLLENIGKSAPRPAYPPFEQIPCEIIVRDSTSLTP